MIIEKKITKKPWGHEILWAKTEDYAGKILVIHAGQRLSKQLHNKKDETVYVLSGELTIETDKEKVNLLSGQSFHIKPKTVHRFCAYNGAVEVIEVSTPQLDDVVRLEDDYQRIK